VYDDDAVCGDDGKENRRITVLDPDAHRKGAEDGRMQIGHSIRLGHGFELESSFRDTLQNQLDALNQHPAYHGNEEDLSV
jgi:hypothetical protein